MSFAGRLRNARKEKGYSQETLAEELEVSRQSITKWETGTAFPELKKLLQLSVVLDKDLDWLLCDERNAMIIGRGTGPILPDSDGQICDIRSLEEAVRERRIRRVLECLDGTEFTERSEDEGFSGERTYMVFGSRMFVTGKGMNPRTGEQEDFFMEVTMPEAAEVLIRYARTLGPQQE